MRVISKFKMKIGDVVIPPNQITEIFDEAKNDYYFSLCLQSDDVQILEDVKEEMKTRKKGKKEE